MLKTIKNLIFKPKNEKYLNELRKYLPKINEIYLQLKDKTDEEILERSNNLKQFYQEEITKVIEAFKEKKRR